MTEPTREFGPAELRQRRRLAAVGAIGTSMVFAMLIWAKLRLVTDIPRTAYAAPEAALRADPASPHAGAHAGQDASAIPVGNAAADPDTHAAASE